MHAAMGELYGKGALILHGEQEFEYHRPLVVGDVLSGEGKIVDLYEKETDSATMTFIVIETVWRDDATGDPVVTEKFNLIGRTKK
jgi:hydroxyacyl-ACP dehydratase HTD2-like protein with hotdog domain